MNDAARARLQVVAAAVLFSTGGAAIKATALSGLQVASLRSGIAALTLLALFPAARRAWSPGTFAIGITYAATMILFVVANKWTTAAGTIFLQATAPLYLVLLAPLVLREPVRGRDLAFMGVLASGMALFFLGMDDPGPTAPRPLAGNVAGALTGVTWAVTLTGLRLSAKGTGAGAGDRAAVAVLAGNTIACLACLPFAVPLPAIAARDAGVVLYLGIFQIGIAYIFLTSGIRNVGALAASLLLLVENTLSPIWAWFFHGEVPGRLSIAGGAVILAATTARTWLDARRARLSPAAVPP